MFDFRMSSLARGEKELGRAFNLDSLEKGPGVGAWLVWLTQIVGSSFIGHYFRKATSIRSLVGFLSAIVY